MFKKCYICGKDICDEYGAFIRKDEKINRGDGKISTMKRNELMEALKNGGKSSKM